MITDEEIEQLPEDPELAFVEFEKIVRERTLESLKHLSGVDADDCYLAYINKVLGASREYKIDALKNRETPSLNSNLYDVYRKLAADVDFYATQIRIRNVGRNRQNSVGLDGNTKTKIHQYIQKIRIILEKVELPVTKRDALFGKLDAFAAEVDKVRTSLQSIMAIWLEVCTDIDEGVKKLRPLLRMINSIAVLMGKAKEIEDTLRVLPLQTAQLEAPRKQLPPPTANRMPSDVEDIPF
jgi:hypothetical protein